MLSLKKSQKGFTILELFIVLIVIGILAALVITTYSGIQAKARNSKRQEDIQTLQTQVESFYSQNGYYPSSTDINSTTWRAKNMSKLSSSVMIDPSAKPQTPNLATKPGAKVYSYAPLNSSGTSCETADTTCATYTLTATFEGSVNSQNTYTKTNLD